MRAPLPPRLPFFVAAAVGGAALAYFLDPEDGKRRRESTRNRALSLATGAYGRGRRLVGRLPRRAPELDDKLLAAEVEAILFRDPGVPDDAIEVEAENGVVVLRGAVERPELVETLAQRVRAVSGVREVENLLEVPERPSRRRSRKR